MVTSADALALAPGEAEALSTEASAFASALPDPAMRERYQRLAAAAAEGTIEVGLLPALETMLELLLARQGSAPTARQPLLGIFGRTPRGKALNAAARDVNRALKSLRGQRIEDVRIGACPGAHTLSFETDRFRLTLTLDASGARVDSLETG